ncbi:MAG TPA: TIM-barrel domain-containing protein [Acidobacteriaceae bacterium]
MAVAWLCVCVPVLAQGAAVELKSGELQMHVEAQPLRYSFLYEGREVFSAHAGSGLRLAGADTSAKSGKTCTEVCTFDVSTELGGKATLTVTLTPHHAELRLAMKKPGARVEFITGGAAPGYGLADQAFLRKHYDTDITNVADDHFLSGVESSRLTSNFAIYPQQKVAMLVVDPTGKIVHSSASEIVQGVQAAEDSATMHYFFGDPHEIYQEFLKVRRSAGYDVLKPKYAMFGVGWEAFGALGWESNEETVRASVDHYLALGYPLSWVVIGSGHWPEGKNFAETTSFGLFNRAKYPAPEKLFAHFHDEGLKVLLGLRIDFLVDGPYSAEGVKAHYFMEENGWPTVYTGGWPKSPYYLLNAQNSEAVAWYLKLVKKWTDFGVDGFKEDYFEFGRYPLRDDKLGTINEQLMKQGGYLIERNAYLASNGDLQRINDFNFNQDQDRGPVNALAFAYAGFPLVYPDIVGGTFGEKLFSTEHTARMGTYFERNAQWATLHSSMGVGEPPWSFADAKVGATMLAATKLHARLQPYIYAQALRFVEDGYPWTMTPLPIAFPGDAKVYGRENAKVRGYEWMIGDALLAAPLYGDDYATATTRDVYLPAGEWMEYDSGMVHKGPVMLKQYPLPVEKTPLFVGGNGIVIETGKDGLVGRVYPVSRGAVTMEFRYPDGVSRSMIDVDVQDWKQVHVEDAAGHTVTASWVRHALEFAIQPGSSYRITDAATSGVSGQKR